MIAFTIRNHKKKSSRDFFGGQEKSALITSSEGFDMIIKMNFNINPIRPNMTGRFVDANN